MTRLDLVVGAFGVAVFFIVAVGMVLSMHTYNTPEER